MNGLLKETLKNFIKKFVLKFFKGTHFKQILWSNFGSNAWKGLRKSKFVAETRVNYGKKNPKESLDIVVMNTRFFEAIAGEICEGIHG